jgi:hypothetical protein
VTAKRVRAEQMNTPTKVFNHGFGMLMPGNWLLLFLEDDYNKLLLTHNCFINK